MSRSQITCPTCKRPLAERRHSGRVVIYAEDGTRRILRQDEVLRCPACDARRVVTVLVDDAPPGQRAA